MTARTQQVTQKTNFDSYARKLQKISKHAPKNLAFDSRKYFVAHEPPHQNNTAFAHWEKQRKSV